MEMLGLDVVGADEGGLVGVTKEAAKAAAAKILPGLAAAAEDALTDKPKDAPKGGAPSAGGGESSFLTKKLVGPIVVWHALLGVVAAGGGLYLWKR